MTEADLFELIRATCEAQGFRFLSATITGPGEVTALVEGASVEQKRAARAAIKDSLPMGIAVILEGRIEKAVREAIDERLSREPHRLPLSPASYYTQTFRFAGAFREHAETKEKETGR